MSIILSTVNRQVKKQENTAHNQISQLTEIHLEITDDEICKQEHLTSYYNFYKGVQGSKENIM